MFTAALYGSLYNYCALTTLFNTEKHTRNVQLQPLAEVACHTVTGFSSQNIKTKTSCSNKRQQVGPTSGAQHETSNLPQNKAKRM